MAEKKRSYFTPSGRMNQDDSILTPSPDSESGNSAFSAGDYRYALNLRIGSSRSDSFGDAENIMGDELVTNYYVRGQGFDNPDFDGSLSGWSQIAVSAFNWTYNVLGAICYPTSATDGDILYQSIPSGLSTAVLEYLVSKPNGILSVVYLDGTSVISTDVLLASYQTGNFLSGTITLNIPDNCDGIGFQYEGSGDLYDIVTIKSAQVFYSTSGSKPAGTNKTIGKLEDKEFQQVYYFNYNSNGDHTICRYDFTDNSIYELLRWSGLNFESTYFVSAAKLDNWMAFTDRNNPPRLIDVDTISDLFLTLGSDFREFHIAHHKWAPIMPPVLKHYSDGSTNNYDKLKNKSIQFAYQYVYSGYLKSRWSPHSAVAERFYDSGSGVTTGIEVKIPGILYDDPNAATQYNYFNHTNTKFTSQVISINIAYRESELDLWKLVKRINVSEGDNSSFIFDGDSDGTPIPKDDFYQLFDTVPFKAGCVEAIDNRFIYGDVLDEKPVAMSPMLTDIGVAEWPSDPGSVALMWNFGVSIASANDGVFTSMTTAQGRELGGRNANSNMTFKSRAKYKVGIQYMHWNGWISGIYTVDAWTYEVPESDGVTQGQYALEFKFDPNFKPPEWAVAYQIVRTNALNIDSFMFGVVNKFDAIIDDPAGVNDLEEVPDFLKTRIAQHFENARIVTGTEYQDYLKTLKNKPLVFSLMSYLRKTKADPGLIIADSSRIYIDINNWYNSSKKNSTGTTNNPVNKLYYNYREGDRIRFLGATTSTPSDSQKTVYDVPILEFTGRGIIIEKPAGLTWLPSHTVGTYTDAEDFIIEIYTPKTPSESDFLYYEVGEWHPVLYPATDNRDWSKSDWTYTNNAAATANEYGDIMVFNKMPFSRGDCHYMTKTQYFDYKTSIVGTSIEVRSACMTNNSDETFGYWERGNGRPSIAYDTLPVEKFKATTLKFSDRIIENSNVNGLNRFRGESQFNYPSEYGRVRALVNTANAQVESVGAILLAIGEREAWSIYVNRTTLEDLSGRTQVILSDKVLGSYNALLGSQGTLNPESVSRDRGRVYWYNGLDGVWCRYGRDGLTELSAYKMRNWFRELNTLMVTKYITDDEKPLALSEFDSFNEELITYNHHSSLPATFRGYDTYKGALFSEEGLGWKSVHSYQPELIGKINNQVLMFKNGDIYLYEKSATRNTFFGVKYDSKIQPVFNQFPTSNKHWQTITIIASNKWSVEATESEYRGLRSLIESRIPLAAFEELEDTYWAAFKNDLNTPNVSDPIVNGRPIKSKAIKVMLKLDPSVTYESLLQYVMVEFTDSPKNA